MTGTLAMGSNTITTSSTVDGRDVSADGTKLDTIETNATADQTDAEIKTAYENNSNTNAFTDALQTKLNGIATSSTANPNAIDNVVEDTTPQLGGSLDVNGNSIVSVSNGNISITPDGTGKVILDGLSHPTADGTNGQALVTDGAGNLSFGDVSVSLSAVGESIIPSTTDTYDLGATSFVWRNIYTGDLHLSNEAKEEGNSVDGTKGNWTIQEGSEALFIVNNKSGKKYKFKLEEI